MLPPVFPHGLPEPIFDDVFLVQGSIRVAPGMILGRNMVVVREGSALTLIDPIRLDARGEEALAKLGEVRHLIRLGHAHGSDVPYYVERFGATYWALPGESADLSVEPVTLERLPFAGELVTLEGLALPEGVIRLDRDGGLLLTCDALQDVRDGMPRSSWLARAAMPFLGFRRDLLVGPVWAKRRSGGRPSALRPELERLLALRFEHLVGAHGGVRRGGAHEAVARAIARL
jgi:hypothetical protein